MNVTILWAQFIKSSPLSSQFLYDIYFTIGLLRSSAPLHVHVLSMYCSINNSIRTSFERYMIIVIVWCVFIDILLYYNHA